MTRWFGLGKVKGGHKYEIFLFNFWMFQVKLIILRGTFFTLTKIMIFMENDALDEGMIWDCNEYDVITRVKQVRKTPHFNRLKQFYLRLVRNNIFIGKNVSNNIPPSCFICAKHPERRIPIMFSCEPFKKLTLTLIEIIQSAGLLRLGDTIEILLFTEYEFDYVENLVLITL